MQIEQSQAGEIDDLVPQVGGWLLVLCLVLTVIYPATQLYAVIASAVPKVIASHTAKGALLLGMYSAAFTSLAMFSMSAGLKLWRVRPGALRFAKRYLLAYLLTNVTYFLFWTALFHPTQASSLAEIGWYHVVGPIASTTLWYVYLEHSKRVRETYREGSTVG
jgi:hypothetical protein